MYIFYIIILITILIIVVWGGFTGWKFINKNNEYFTQKREYLLFSSIGDRESTKNAVSMWLKDFDRNYDTVFYYYKDNPLNCPADYCKYKKGFKFENFMDYASNNDISGYKAIWIVDDDIQIDTKDINTMFKIFTKYKLDLGTPSFSKNSDTWWIDVLGYKKGNILHYTDFVEVNTPIFSQKGLNICFPTFNNSKTAWGLDFIWSKLLNSKNIGVINEVQIYNSPEESSALDDTSDTGLVREDHAIFGIELMKKWNIEKFTPRILSYIKK